MIDIFKRKIVGICGTHGTGKSTILQGVKAAGYPVIETSLSREAQKKLGWEKLSEAEKSVDNMWALQSAIISAMAHRDYEIAKGKDIVTVERTPADIWAYTAMWCHRLGINELDDPRSILYREQCVFMMRNYAMLIQVPAIDDIPFVEEPNRADLKSRVFVGVTIDNFIWSGGFPCHKMTAITPALRAAEAVEVVHEAAKS